MAPTAFQKIAVDHVPFPLDGNGHGQSAPLDYPRLKSGKFEAVYFRSEEGADYVAQRMNYCVQQDTFRGKFDANVWFADPLSADSQAAGIPTDAAGWAIYIATFANKLRILGHRPTVLGLNVEFSGKGYPPHRPSALIPQWGHMWARSTDGIPRLYVASIGGTTGAAAPKFPVSGNVKDGGVLWNVASSGEYPYWRGWDWCETVASTLISRLSAPTYGMADQHISVQPLSMQSDFNFGAWMIRGMRMAPQCYGDEPYNALSAPGNEIGAVIGNPYVKPFYGLTVNSHYVHPTLGAYGQGSTYVPWLKAARKKYGVFGMQFYRHDAFKDSDYTDYAQFAVA